jgi:hypothetical protein
MMMNPAAKLSPMTMLLLIGTCLVGSSGCVQMAANLLSVVRGPAIPAEFKIPEEKLVAVVCTNETGICRDETTIRLAGTMRGILAVKLPKTKFVSQDLIDQWIEGSSSSEKDIAAIGQGVEADYVIAVDILNLKLKDGPTLYRGRSNLTTTVWDVKADKPVFRKAIPEHAYPVMAGQSTTETDEVKFRRVYLMQVADKLSRYFYAHEIGEDVAMDATILKY